MKKILSVLMSLMMVFSVAGCEQKAQATNNETKNTVQIEQQAKKETKPEVKQTESKENKKITAEEKLKTEKIPTKNAKLTKDEVIKRAIEKSDKLKSVTVNYKINVQMLDEKKKPTKNQNNVDITGKIIYSKDKDEKGFNKISKMYDKTNIDNQITEAYVDMDNNKLYLNDDNKGLKEYKKDDLKPQTESNYDSVLKIFAMVKDNMKMTETDKTYNFTYKSDMSTPEKKALNGEMIFKLDAPFGMGISLKHLDEIDASVTYKISKKDFTLVSIEEVFNQTVDNQHYKSTGKFTLQSVDDLKEIPEAKNLK